jgi:hypothetical protein
MHLGLERPKLAVLSDELSHDSLADRKPPSQNLIASLVITVRGDNPLPQVDR